MPQQGDVSLLAGNNCPHAAISPRVGDILPGRTRSPAPLRMTSVHRLNCSLQDRVVHRPQVACPRDLSIKKSPSSPERREAGGTYRVNNELLVVVIDHRNAMQALRQPVYFKERCAILSRARALVLETLAIEDNAVLS